MRSLYNRIFKFDQVTYGRPYQIKVPVKTDDIVDPDSAEIDETDNEAKLLSTSEDIIKKARQESELIIKEAGCEAKRIISEAREEAEKEAKRQQEEAWQKGYAEGLEAAKAQYEALLAEAEEIKKSSIEERSSMLAGMEKDILELVLNVARKVVAAELTVNREVILQLLRDALNDCSSKESASIKVSPEDYDVLNEHMEEIMSITGASDSIEIKKDVSMKKGDIIIDTKLGGINAGVQTKLEKIEESFKELSGGN
jgi:flagellar assembly protein FliH